MSDWNRALIDQLRANGGEVTSGPMAGRPLLILTTIGARTGERREAVLTYTRDGDRYVVAASAGGSPRAPAWFHNLAAHPDASAEIKGQTLPVRAVVAEAPERDRLWRAHVTERPEFADYPARAGRVIPVIKLEPTAEA